MIEGLFSVYGGMYSLCACLCVNIFVYVSFGERQRQSVFVITCDYIFVHKGKVFTFVGPHLLQTVSLSLLFPALADVVFCLQTEYMSTPKSLSREYSCHCLPAR